jgi:hypothetical protein
MNFNITLIWRLLERQPFGRFSGYTRMMLKWIYKKQIVMKSILR